MISPERSKSSSSGPVTSKTSSSESEKDEKRSLNCNKTTFEIDPLSGIAFSSSSNESECTSEVSYPGKGSTTVESSPNTFADDSPQDTVTSSQQEIAKTEADVKNLTPRQDVTHQEKLTNSHSVQEKNTPVGGNLFSFKSVDDCKSNTTQFTGSMGDPDILPKLKKEFEKGDAGLMSCLYFLKETVGEQKRINKKLLLRITDEDLLFRSLKRKINKNKEKLNKILKVQPKSQQKSNAKAEAEEKKSAKLSSREKIEHQKSSNNHSAECGARPRLTLKINRLR